MYKIKDEVFNNQIIGKIIIKQNADGTIVSFGEWADNTDYQAYLKWVGEGGVPTPADE
jgi:hypothetical protein